MRFSLLVALGAVALLTGCTQPQSSASGKFKGDEKDVAQVVADLSSDAARRKQAHVCGEILTDRLQKLIAGDSSCPNEVKKAFEDADQASLDVDDVTVSGSTATARVSSKDAGGRVRRTFKLVKVGNDWRIDSFG